MTSSPGCAVGAFVNGMENLAAFQTLIGKKLATVLCYVHWFTPFPREEMEKVTANGSIPLITWEPWITDQRMALQAIAEGAFDPYCVDFLNAAAESKHPILLRFAHEMNGDWYPWDGSHNGGKIAGAENYLQAWKYIYRLAKKIGPDKIKLVWCPNNISQPEMPWNQMEKYFPGDEYVDWVGLDGYNWGYSRTQSFADIFGPAYRSLIRLSSRPLMLGEFACAEDAAAGEQRKADWIDAALASLENDFPAVKLFNWFNINKERDWRVESSPAAIRSFRNMLQKGYFLDKI